MVLEMLFGGVCLSDYFSSAQSSDIRIINIVDVIQRKRIYIHLQWINWQFTSDIKQYGTETRPNAIYYFNSLKKVQLISCFIHLDTTTVYLYLHMFARNSYNAAEVVAVLIIILIIMQFSNIYHNI